MRNDKALLRRSFDLARLGRSGTKTNPIVGAVIAKDGKVIAEGYHQKYGGHHAEVEAIHQADKQDLSGHQLYVSLEPCTHYGKTPPCADLIVKKGFESCFIGTEDINPIVLGKGVLTLQSVGITVSTDLLPNTGKALVHQFAIQQQLKRPYIILKWAQTYDGYLGMKGFRTKISNPFSDRLVHKWRSESDAILVGTNTVIIDNPRLDNRLHYGPTPTKVLLDFHGRIPANAAVFNSPGPVLIFSQNANYQTTPSKDRLTHVRLGKDRSLEYIFSELYRHNIGSILVEGGKAILDECLQHGLWDECRVIMGSKKLGDGIPAPRLNVLPQVTFDMVGDTLSIYKRPTS